ncbi:MAG: helix-turn-helix transcriptional regulator [Bacteroidales bacterium]|nr:helix-turn-helix transcriptional regulator [Bacteroidales bacterium]
MSKTAELFDKRVSEIPQDIKLRVDWSFRIADEISRILKEKKMTQKDFAKLIGRSEAEVCRWVGGTHNFTLSTLALISTTLETPLIKISSLP